MIQRVQSVYLLLITVMMSFLLVWSYADVTLADGQILTFRTHKIEYNIGLENVSTYKVTIPVFALVMITGLLSFLNIFLFQHRIIQLRLCLLNSALLVFMVILMLIYYLNVGRSLHVSHHAFRFPAILPLVSFVMNVMAYRNIQRDEMIVKSYDRIR